MPRTETSYHRRRQTTLCRRVAWFDSGDVSRRPREAHWPTANGKVRVPIDRGLIVRATETIEKDTSENPMRAVNVERRLNIFAGESGDRVEIMQLLAATEARSVSRT